LSRWQDADQWIDQRDKDKDPKDPDFRLLRARSYLGAFRLREAAGELESLVRDSPDLPAVYFYLAQVAFAQSKQRKRSRLWPMPSAFSQDICRRCWALAILVKAKRSKCALAYASRVIATSFWVDDAHVLAGSSYLLLGDLTQAQRAFELAAGLNRRSPAAEERLGKVFGMKGNYADAERPTKARWRLRPITLQP